jgi:hypothetical protein
MDSGFDGTVIHFYNPEKGINHSYTITRGSESEEDKKTGQPLDWIYNALGIYAGKTQGQYRDAKLFDDIVTKKINEKVETDLENKRLEKSGLTLKKSSIGHSLGGNLAQMLQLMNNSFGNTNVINDASPSAYQLAFIDRDFSRAIRKEFGINSYDMDQIYTIHPDKLKTFAENYYKEKGINIHHLTNEEDMLFAASRIRGFLNLGDRTILDSDPHFEGIHDRLEKLSDEDLHAMQMFLVKHAPAYQEGGYNGFIKSVTGIDLVFFEEFRNSFENINILEDPKGFIDSTKKMVTLLDDLAVNLKNIAAQLPNLMKNLPVLLSILTDLTSEEIARIVDEVKGMQEDIASILQMIESLNDIATFKELIFGNFIGYLEEIKNIKDIFNTINSEIQQFFGRFDAVKKIIEDGLMEFGGAVEGHSLTQVANALAKNGRRYDPNTGDMLLSKNGGDGEKIEVNLSSAVRIYQKGMDTYGQKKDVINKFKMAYEQNYIEDFDQRKKTLLNRIYDMESNPRSYQYLLSSRGNCELTSITVHEQITPLSALFKENFELATIQFEEEYTKGTELLSRIRSSIEEMFDQEKNISAIFDLK